MRWRRFWVNLLLLLLIHPNLFGCIGCIRIFAGAAPDLTAKSAFLMDLNTGETYWSKEAKLRVFPASITKLMTALLVLEGGGLDRTATASPKAVETDGSALWVDYDEVLTVRDLLYGLLLISGNDAAVVLAEIETGDEADFVARMNQKAAELGAGHTHFSNSHGLHEDDHYTTAADFALIARAAWQQPGLIDILQTIEYQMPSPDPQEPRVLINNNRLLDSFDGMLGGKNGYTVEAGYTFVGYASQRGMDLLSIVFDSQSVWEDTEALLQFGFDHIGSYVTLAHGVQAVIANKLFSVVYAPSRQRVGSITANRVLRLQPRQSQLHSDQEEALLLEQGFAPTEVSLRYQGASFASLPIWRQPIFWISVHLLFWILIFGVYRLLRARIEYLRQYRRYS